MIIESQDKTEINRHRDCVKINNEIDIALYLAKEQLGGNIKGGQVIG